MARQQQHGFCRRFVFVFLLVTMAAVSSQSETVLNGFTAEDDGVPPPLPVLLVDDDQFTDNNNGTTTTTSSSTSSSSTCKSKFLDRMGTGLYNQTQLSLLLALPMTTNGVPNLHPGAYLTNSYYIVFVVTK